MRGGRGGGTSVIRSPIVELFRMNASSWTLDDAKGHLEELSRDQEGSRFIQRMLETHHGTPQVQMVFDELLGENPTAPMMDVFGNYVVQRMLDFGSAEQIHRVATCFEGNVLALTLHTYGCRVVQKAIQTFSREDRLMVLNELHSHVAHCVQDQNGNHVIQKCIEFMPDDHDFIIDRFVGHVHEFATHAYGCRVIQCIFANNAKRQNEILEEVVANVDALSIDQFGNYVIQHVLQTSQNKAAVASMLSVLRPKFFPYCTHKFASNVMEKVFIRSDEANRTALLKQLMEPAAASEAMPRVPEMPGVDGRPGQPMSYLLMLMRDQYGNYVVQQMIDAATPKEKELMVEHVSPHVAALRRFTYGKHIVARLERTTMAA